MPTNQTSYTTNSSALPESLATAGANIVLDPCDNYIYKPPDKRVVNKTETLKRFTDPANYDCSNDEILELDPRQTPCFVRDQDLAVALDPWSWLVTAGLVLIVTAWK